MKPINHLQELSRIPENKEFECMTLLEKVMFLYKRLTRKQNNLISGKNIMTINGTDILQSGNLEIESGTAGVLYINTDGDDGNLTPEDIEKLNTENGNVVIINDNEYYHKMYENNVYYAFVNVDTITTTHISYKAIYINKDRNTFNKEESTELIDYNDIINKPSLNGIILSGNVYSSELGISYNDLTDTPTIPTKTSELINDSGFITNTYHDNSKQDKLTAGTNITIENNVISATGTGGTSDYNDLSNKPSINNVTLSGNKSLTQLGIASNVDVVALELFKQDKLQSGTNIKSINNKSILGSGNIEINAELDPTELLNYIYPVGSIYMSVNNVSPQTFLGGTWEQIKDKFLLSAGDTYTAGSTGGEATHLLTANESGLRSHDHKMRGISSRQSGNWNGCVASAGSSDTNWNSVISVSGQNALEAHNNMPPYLTVYMWKRTN